MIAWNNDGTNYCVLVKNWEICRTAWNGKKLTLDSILDRGKYPNLRVKHVVKN